MKPKVCGYAESLYELGARGHWTAAKSAESLLVHKRFVSGKAQSLGIISRCSCDLGLIDELIAKLVLLGAGQESR